MLAGHVPPSQRTQERTTNNRKSFWQCFNLTQMEKLNSLLRFHWGCIVGLSCKALNPHRSRWHLWFPLPGGICRAEHRANLSSPIWQKEVVKIWLAPCVMLDELSGQLIFNPLLVKAGSGPNHLVTVELMESNGEMSLHPTQLNGLWWGSSRQS